MGLPSSSRWLLASLALLAAPAAGAAPASFTLVFTGSQRGWVESCGCTLEPLGGVDRVKGEVDKVRREGPALFVDAGDLLFDKEDMAPAAACAEDARVALLVKAAQANALEFTALGPFDMSRGDAARAKALAAAGVQALAANVQGATGVKPRALKEVGGVKVGLVGVTWPQATQPLPHGTPWKGLTLLPPQPALAREVEALRKDGARVVVLLAQASRADVQGWAGSVKGIDIVLLGRDPGEKPRAPEEIAPGTWLLSAGDQGMFLGRADVTVAGPGPLALDDQGRAARAEAGRLDERAAHLEAQARAAAAQGDAANAAARRARIQELDAQADALRSRAAAPPPPPPNRLAVQAVKLDDKAAIDVGMARQLAAFRRALPGLHAACKRVGK